VKGEKADGARHKAQGPGCKMNAFGQESKNLPAIGGSELGRWLGLFNEQGSSCIREASVVYYDYAPARNKKAPIGASYQ